MNKRVTMVQAKCEALIKSKAVLAAAKAEDLKTGTRRQNLRVFGIPDFIASLQDCWAWRTL